MSRERNIPTRCIGTALLASLSFFYVCSVSQAVSLDRDRQCSTTEQANQDSPSEKEQPTEPVASLAVIAVRPELQTNTQFDAVVRLLRNGPAAASCSPVGPVIWEPAPCEEVADPVTGSRSAIDAAFAHSIARHGPPVPAEAN